MIFVANHAGVKIPAFDVSGETLTPIDPSDYYTVSFEHGEGMIDIEIDELAGRLFVSYEDTTGIISQLDAWDGTFYSDSIVGSNMEITGLAFDSKRFLLYGTERNTNKLHVIDLKSTQQLRETVELANINYACGLALNENSDVLYVSEYYYLNPPTFFEKIKAYDIHNNFAFLAEIDMEISTVGIAYDGTRNILYGTAYNEVLSPKLTKKNLSNGSVISKSLYPDSPGIGIAVDEETGYVFVSSYYRWEILCDRLRS